MATARQLRAQLDRITTILWNYGATFPVPQLERYGPAELGFSLAAELPGLDAPRPATIRMAEIWQQIDQADYTRAQYAYDLIDYPGDRRRAFHGHDPDYFARQFSVLVHEHCEERLGFAECSHHYGLPIDAFEALEFFTRLWAQPGPLGCAELRCID